MEQAKIKNIHITRKQAFQAATRDLYLTGGSISIECRDDYRDAFPGSALEFADRMEIMNYRDNCEKQQLPCYHTRTESEDRLDFFIFREPANFYADKTGDIKIRKEDSK